MSRHGAALVGIAPKDELEGMMAVELIAAHSDTMECYRRAMIGDQIFERLARFVAAEAAWGGACASVRKSGGPERLNSKPARGSARFLRGDLRMLAAQSQHVAGD